MIIDCEPSPLYTLHEYVLPEFIARAMSIVCIKINNIKDATTMLNQLSCIILFT